MEAVLLAADAHARLGLIVAQADSAIASIRRRERIARELARSRVG